MNASLTTLLLWLAGWLIAIRPTMRRRMLLPVCTKCGAINDDCFIFPGSTARGEFPVTNHPPKYAALGATRERNSRDVAAAVWRAAWWPILLAWWLLAGATRLAGRGVAAAVIRSTPLTEPELERRIAEQAREIERLNGLIK
jgi:hypothetical protein